MRTKILLATAAALAAGVFASNAQVYSANIVGYVNQTWTGAGTYTLAANPLDNGNGDYLTNTVDPSGTLPNKAEVLTWNGTGFNIAEKLGGVWNSNPVLYPGTGFFVFLPASASTTSNVYVGNVIANVGASVTNTIPAGTSLWGSPLPFSGDLTTDDTNLNVNTALTVNKSEILLWNGTGYNISELLGGSWNNPAPVVPGQGFFLLNKGSAANFVQTTP